MAEQGEIGNDEPRNALIRLYELADPLSSQKSRKKMTISARPIALFADFAVLRASSKDLRSPSFCAVAAPGAAGGRKGGGYDGLWNVLIITQSGNCDPAYSYPFRVSGGRDLFRGRRPMCPEALAGAVALWSGFRPAARWRPAAAGSVAVPARVAGAQGLSGDLQRPLAGDAGLTRLLVKKSARQIA